MADYEDDSFEDLPEEDSIETSEQQLRRRSSSILSPQPKLILEDDYEDDYVQDDDESWDEPSESDLLRPPVALNTAARPQSAVINGGRPESGGLTRPTSALPSHTERIVIEPSNRDNLCVDTSKQNRASPHTGPKPTVNIDDSILEVKWELPVCPKTPRMRFRGDETNEWPAGPRAGRRKVPCRPTSANEEIDYAEAIRARAALDVVVGKLREKTKSARNQVVEMWRDKHNELEERVIRVMEKLEQTQAEEAKREKHNLKHKILPQNTNKISKKVIDLMALAASHAVASSRSSRLSVSLEKQRDYSGGLLVTRGNYINAVYHDEKRIALEKKVRQANSYVDKTKVLSKKMSRNFAVDTITHRHKKEMGVVAKKAEAEQNRLVAQRNKSLQLLNFHAQNTEEVLTHAELLERNLRNSATVMGSAGVAADMARQRSDRAMKDLQRHCQEAARTALNFKLEFHAPLSAQEVEEEIDVEEQEEKIDSATTGTLTDDQTAPANHTMAVDTSPAHSRVSDELNDTETSKLSTSKKTKVKRRRFRRPKPSTVYPVHICTWCGSGVKDVARLVFLPAVGGPIGTTPSHFCTWGCAKSYNMKYSPVMHKHTRDVLIDLEAGRLVPESAFKEKQLNSKHRK